MPLPMCTADAHVPLVQVLERVELVVPSTLSAPLRVADVPGNPSPSPSPSPNPNLNPYP